MPLPQLWFSRVLRDAFAAQAAGVFAAFKDVGGCCCHENA
jgi:hypothetical protein